MDAEIVGAVERKPPDFTPYAILACDNDVWFMDSDLFPTKEDAEREIRLHWSGEDYSAWVVRLPDPSQQQRGEGES